MAKFKASVALLYYILLGEGLTNAFLPLSPKSVLMAKRSAPSAKSDNGNLCSDQHEVSLSSPSALWQTVEDKNDNDGGYSSSVPKAFRSITALEARRPVAQSGLRYRSNDWLLNFLSLPNSFVLGRIRFHLFTNTALSFAVVLLNRLFGWNQLAVPLTGHSLMGGFLSLLLVFRTNTAYARFYEARTVWSQAKSTCRNLALTVTYYMHAPSSAARLQKQLAVFPEALAYTCLSGYGVSISDDLRQLLPANISLLPPAVALCASMHQTVHEACKESTTIAEDRVEALHLTHISHLIDSLVSKVSSCEKIVRTPVPWSYSRHTSRFLTAWSGTLPFALVQPLGWFTVPVVSAASWWQTVRCVAAD